MPDLLLTKIPDNGLDHMLLRSFVLTSLTSIAVTEITHEIKFIGKVLKDFNENLDTLSAIQGIQYYREKFDTNLISLEDVFDYFEEKEGLVTKFEKRYDADKNIFLEEIDSHKTRTEFESAIIRDFFSHLEFDMKVSVEQEKLTK
jgi:hypothetical protein